MTTARAIGALVLALALVDPGVVARADDAEAERAEPLEGESAAETVDARSPIERGRAFTWGLAAIVPILLGDVRESSGRTIAYLNPGGGVEGRVGYELEHGIAIGVTGGVSAFVSENSRALASYRGGVEGRWTIDVGGVVAPTVGLAAGVLMLQLDAGIAATAYARLLLGAQILLAPWVALEAGVSVEGALGIDAIADPFVWISPQLGISFYE